MAALHDGEVTTMPDRGRPCDPPPPQSRVGRQRGTAETVLFRRPLPKPDRRVSSHPAFQRLMPRPCPRTFHYGSSGDRHDIRPGSSADGQP